MKAIYSLLFLSAVVVSGACKKNANGSDVQILPPDARMYRIVQGIDPDIKKDTVFLISYNDSGYISHLLDSTHQQTMIPVYDYTGKLIRIDQSLHGKAEFSYDSTGLLQEVLTGTGDKIVFHYTNGVVRRKTVYSPSFEGPLQVLRYYDYTVTNGNITTIEEHAGSGYLLTTSVLAYTTEENPFRQLGLFTFQKGLGTTHLIEPESFFNRNLLKSVTTNTTPIISNEYTFNEQHLPVKSQTKLLYAPASGLVTRQFMYR